MLKNSSPEEKQAKQFKRNVTSVTAKNSLIAIIQIRIGTITRGRDVTGDQNSGCLRLWISYPWVNNEERDFNYLVPQLKESGIEATYDSIKLQPDARLGQRIVQRLLSIGFDGWLYILTHQCFTRRNYTDVLTQAIDQTLFRMGPKFPMAGLMHGIAPQHVPAVLRVLPCISLGDSDWRNRLSGVLNGYGAQGKNMRETRFIWKIHPSFDGDPAMTAIEVRSRGESIQYWRFAIPKASKVVKWGQGRAGGTEISRITFAEAKGNGRYENQDVSWFGAANAISNTESAFAVFNGPIPDFICFGPSQTPFGSPDKMEIYSMNFINQG
jgi:hypothetical protein